MVEITKQKVAHSQLTLGDDHRFMRLDQSNKAVTEQDKGDNDSPLPLCHKIFHLYCNSANIMYDNL